MKHPHRHLALRYSAVLLVFSLVFAATFHEILLHPGSRLACCASDSTGSIRDYWLAGYEHSTPFTLTLDRFNGAPEGTPSTPATALANGGLQTAFVWALRGPLGLVGAWNLFLFLGLIGTGVAMFALLDRLGCAFVPSLFGSYVFAVSPYTLERAYAGHLGLLQNWVLVLAVAAMIRLRRVRSLGSAALVGGTLALAFYISAYQGLFAAFIVFAFLMPEFWRLRTRPERISSVALLSAIYCSTAFLLIPILVLFSKERAAVQASAGHTYGDLYLFSAHITSYFVPSPRNPLFHWVRGFHPADLVEETLFVGFTTLALAIVAFVLIRRRDTWFRESGSRWWTSISMMVLAVLAFAVSFQPVVRVGRVPIIMPSFLFAALTTYWRDYARFGVLFGLAAATLAAFALTALAQRRARRWRALPLVALTLVVLELLPGNVSTFDTAYKPAWIAWLASHPSGIVADYPLAINQRDESLGVLDYWYTKLDRDPRFETVGVLYYQEYGRIPTIRLLAENIHSPVSVDVLIAEGVHYVVIHDDVYRSLHQRPPVPDPRLKLVARLKGVRVYSLPPKNGRINTVLRSNEPLIARLQHLKKPVVPITELRVAQSRRRPANPQELEVRNFGLATELRMSGVVSNGGPKVVLRLENSHGQTLARQVIGPGVSKIRLGPIKSPAKGTFKLTLLANPSPGVAESLDPARSLVLTHISVDALPAIAAQLK